MLAGLLGLALFVCSAASAQEGVPAGARLMREGRFEVVAFPAEERLGRSMLADAVARDSFPGLRRLTDTVRIVLAPDAAAFRACVG